MECIRCAGLRVPEIICEGGTRVMALRCVRCGDVVDRVIVHNRLRRQCLQPTRARTPVYGSARWKRNRPVLL
jgi:hypothetical protein